MGFLGRENTENNFQKFTSDTKKIPQNISCQILKTYCSTPRNIIVKFQNTEDTISTSFQRQGEKIFILKDQSGFELFNSNTGSKKNRVMPSKF